MLLLLRDFGVMMVLAISMEIDVVHGVRELREGEVLERGGVGEERLAGARAEVPRVQVEVDLERDEGDREEDDKREGGGRGAEAADGHIGK